MDRLGGLRKSTMKKEQPPLPQLYRGAVATLPRGSVVSALYALATKPKS